MPKRTFDEEEIKKIRIGDHIDHRDITGRWLQARVLEFTEEAGYKITYVGWTEKWDEWSKPDLQPWRFAESGSLSEKEATNALEVNDSVKVNLRHVLGREGQTLTEGHDVMVEGFIRKVRKNQAQVKFLYSLNSEQWQVRWFSMDDPDELELLVRAQNLSEESDVEEEVKSVLSSLWTAVDQCSLDWGPQFLKTTNSEHSNHMFGSTFEFDFCQMRFTEAVK